MSESELQGSIPEKALKKVADLTGCQIKDLILSERLLVSEIFLYVLKPAPNRHIWPFLPLDAKMYQR